MLKDALVGVLALMLCSTEALAQGSPDSASRQRYCETTQEDYIKQGEKIAVSCKPDPSPCTAFVLVWQVWTAQDLTKGPLNPDDPAHLWQMGFTSFVAGNGKDFYIYEVEYNQIRIPTGPFKSVDEAVSWWNSGALMDANPRSPTYGKPLMGAANQQVYGKGYYDPPAGTQPKPITRSDFQLMLEQKAEEARDESYKEQALQRIFSLGVHFFEPQPEVKAALAKAGYPLWTCVPANGSYDDHEARYSDCVTKRGADTIEVDFIVAEIFVDPDTQLASYINLEGLMNVGTNVHNDYPYEGTSFIDCTPANKSQGQITPETCH